MPRGRRAVRRTRRRRRRVRRRRVLLVGGLVAFGTYKMTTRNAERIEQHTGVPPEELDDQELEQAMQELDIPKETVTSADQEQGGAAAPSTPQQASPAAASSGTDLDQLEKLADLHAQGILTDEEFAAKKKQILGL